MEATTVANLCFLVFAKPETAALEKTYFFPDITLHCYWYVVFQKSSSSETEESIVVLQDQRSGLGSKMYQQKGLVPIFPITDTHVPMHLSWKQVPTHSD